ncbi:ABC transporter ATP-binding protein [uncultured Cohaesibacter sp.]|uniref:ABC transporter ATP-binding protein n=1 Tax=uncultured Cohaesibacter sp. TaxID=1002546 RepID=UPI002AA7F5E7|nr:ABC transporter ATP-binding protein [uncultured Cohaesibacter sp.]
MIELHNLHKKYNIRGGKQKHILRGVTTKFPKRNIGLMGENGAGKSTLLRMIAGFELPDKGTIVKNVNVSFPLGFKGSFNGSLSGLQNTRFVARIYGKNTEEVIDYVKEFSELGEHFYAPVKTYSSGMGAKLAFGVSLAIDFDCYLIDELTAVGDKRFRNKSKEALKSKFDDDGANLIMVSHSEGTIKEYCDYGIIIRDGKLHEFDDIDEAVRFHNEYMDR